MSNSDFPEELKGVWDNLSKELSAKRFQKHLATLKEAIQSTLLMANSMRNQFQPAAEPGPDAVLAGRKALVSGLELHSLTLGSLQGIFSSLSAEAKGLVQRVLDWIVSNIMEVLTKFSSQLNVVSWAVEVTSGLPLGFSLSITVTFK